MDKREEDIQALCSAVLYMSTRFYDNPNGAYESSCPFCCSTVYRGGSKNVHASMSEIDHDKDCQYLIAKDLSTNMH